MNKVFKKKILHRAKYRGIKELDIIFEKFVLLYGNKINNSQLLQLEELLNIPDNELLEILLNKRKIPTNLDNNIMRKIISICNG